MGSAPYGKEYEPEQASAAQTFTTFGFIAPPVPRSQPAQTTRATGDSQDVSPDELG